MVSVLRKALLVSTFCFTTQAMGYDFSTADSLFKQRGESLDAARQAYDIYADAVATTTGEDQEYAAGQLGRSAVFIGHISSEVDNEGKKEILERCVKDLEPAESLGSQQFYYYYISCSAFRGRLANLAGRIFWATKIIRVQEAALDATRVSGELRGGFEGGGILRVMSAVRGNRIAKPLGLFNIEEAIQFGRLALQAPARPDRALPESLSGLDYFENYYFLAQALAVNSLENDDLSSLEESFDVLDQALAEIETRRGAGTLPQGRNPEMAFYEASITRMLDAVDTCLAAEGDWKPCVEGALKK